MKQIVGLQKGSLNASRYGQEEEGGETERGDSYPIIWQKIDFFHLKWWGEKMSNPSSTFDVGI